MIAALKAWARRLKREVLAISLAVRDPRTPWYARALGVVVVAYALSPIDLVPDFVPVLGLLDDAILLPLGIWLVVRLVPPDALADARVAAAELERQPASRAGAALVVACWCAAAGCAYLAYHALYPG